MQGHTGGVVNAQCSCRNGRVFGLARRLVVAASRCSSATTACTQPYIQSYASCAVWLGHSQVMRHP